MKFIFCRNKGLEVVIKEHLYRGDFDIAVIIFMIFEGFLDMLIS